MISKTSLLKRIDEYNAHNIAAIMLNEQLIICEVIPVYTIEETKKHRVYYTAEEAEACFKLSHQASLIIYDDVSSMNRDMTETPIGYYIKRVN